VHQVFKKSFLAEALDWQMKLNSYDKESFDKGSFDKGKPRKRGLSEDASLTAEARRRCDEVERLVAACKEFHEEAEAVLDRVVGLVFGP